MAYCLYWSILIKDPVRLKLFLLSQSRKYAQAHMPRILYMHIPCVR